MRSLITIAAIALLSLTFNSAMAAKHAHLREIPGLNPKVLKLALNGYSWAIKKGRVDNPNVITVVDFTKPSYQKRLWVIDLRNGKILMHAHVTHGPTQW